MCRVLQVYETGWLSSDTVSAVLLSEAVKEQKKAQKEAQKAADAEAKKGDEVKKFEQVW